jgi:hypothetical protein
LWTFPRVFPSPWCPLLPEWYSDDKNFMAMVFDFGSSLVHDNGMLLFFHKDNLKLRADIRGYSKAYYFSILK